MSRLFISGANGFIGTRLAEVAVARGHEVVGLVRSFARTARIARLPVRLIKGDIMDPSSMSEGLRGCDIVVHCAVDFRASEGDHIRSSALGSRNVATAAAALGVRRFVHLSSAGVHGLDPVDGSLPETIVTKSIGHAYCDGKARSEIEVNEVAGMTGLELVIARPTIVWGPFGTHDAMAVRLLRENRLVLVDGAYGHFNGIFIDNLVDGLLAAATSGARGIFHLTDGGSETWRDFLLAHAYAVGRRELPEVTSAELEIAWTGKVPDPISEPSSLVMTLRRSRPVVWFFGVPGVHQAWGAVRRKVGHPLPDLPSRPRRLDPGTLPTRDESNAFQTFRQVRFSADSARTHLGFNPRVSFTEGAARTAKWIEWARL